MSGPAGVAIERHPWNTEFEWVDRTDAPSTLTVEQVEAFDALAPEWDALVEAAPRPSPFMLHGWLDEWWRHSSDDDEERNQTLRPLTRFGSSRSKISPNWNPTPAS